MRGQAHRPAQATKKPRALFPFAVTLRAVALITEGDGRGALYVCTEDHGAAPSIHRLPEGCRVTVRAPYPLPQGGPRVFLPAGSSATFQAPDGRTSTLALHAVRVCRELLEALEAHARQTGAGKQGAA